MFIFLKEGSKAEASRVFGVSRTIIYRWLVSDALAQKPGCKGSDKLDEAALREAVRRYPNKLRECAEEFDMSINGIWVALKRMGIQKNTEICRTRPS